jgi:hypothetical protein
MRYSSLLEMLFNVNRRKLESGSFKGFWTQAFEDSGVDVVFIFALRISNMHSKM